MAEWKVHSDLWLVRQEQIGPNAWLLCFLSNPERGPAYYGTADGWVNVMSEEWHEGTRSNVLEKFELYGTGALELECIAHEMRAKYGETT